MSNYFHTDDQAMLTWLARVLTRAEGEGLSIRLKTDSQNRLMLKLGGGMWTAPIESTPDPYRDQTPDPDPQPDTDDGLTCEKCQGTNGMHYLDCDAFAWL